jgi:hypothetical protein
MAAFLPREPQGLPGKKRKDRKVLLLPQGDRSLPSGKKERKR